MNSTFTTNCHCERPVGSVAVSWLSPAWEIAPVGGTRTFIAMTNAGTKPMSLWGACDEESRMWWHSEPVGMEWALGFYIDRWPILILSLPAGEETLGSGCWLKQSSGLVERNLFLFISYRRSAAGIILYRTYGWELPSGEDMSPASISCMDKKRIHS